MMKSSRFLLVPAFLISGALIAQDAQVTPIQSKDLADFPGKEGQGIIGRVSHCARISAP